MNEDALVETMALLTCDVGCGDLTWTLREHGRVTHKHACPARRELYCQSHPVCLDVAKAALRGEGFEVYRPEECRRVVVKYGELEADVYDGIYLMVPVGEGTDDE